MAAFKVLERKDRSLVIEHKEGHTYSFRVVDHPDGRRTLSVDVGVWQNDEAKHGALSFKSVLAFARREARHAGMID